MIFCFFHMAKEKADTFSLPRTRPFRFRLRSYAPELTPMLTHLFRYSYSIGIVPERCKSALIHPIPKKDDVCGPSYYTLIAITFLLSKVIELILTWRRSLIECGMGSLKNFHRCKWIKWEHSALHQGRFLFRIHARERWRSPKAACCLLRCFFCILMTC